MLTLPIPMFGALVLAFLLFRLVAAERRVGPLAVLVGICALQSLIIALAQHYGLTGWRLLQPVTASIIPAAAWLAFVTSAIRAPRRADVAHLLGPLAAVTALGLAPGLLDLLLPVLFLSYAAAILAASSRGVDALARLRLETGDLPVQVWVVIAVTLGLSAFSDVAIMLARGAGAGWLQPVLISVFSAANLLLIGGLSLSGALRADPVDPADGARDGTVRSADARSVAPDPADGAIMERLEALMRAQRPYLDPDLSLVRLARKLGIPAKQLSAAINRSTGQNVSRYINDARIAAAQALLGAGEPVTATIYASGFNTKSNFNREFLRVTGRSPTDWMRTEGIEV